jgi:hypothetical protein
LRAATRMLIVAALTVCALLATASVASAFTWEISTYVNGNVKAHAVYYQNGRTMCTNLLNAPNQGAYSTAALIDPRDGSQLAWIHDFSNDGQRICAGLPAGWAGRSMLLRSTFHNANGNATATQMWITV